MTSLRLSPSRAVVAAVLSGVLFSSLVAFRVYSSSDGDITAFVSFGEDDAVTAQYGRERMDGEIFLRNGLGHDGKFFFIQANDPLLSDPEDNASYLDRPVYRSQRMLYPMLAGGFGAFPPETIPWAMLLVNLLAMAVGTWGVASIAREMGGSPWWGLAFPLNVGFISELSIDGAGVVAGATAFAAVAMLQRNRIVGSVALLVASALSREAMLLVAAGSALWLWRHGRRRDSVMVLGAPVAAVAAWALFVRIRLGFGGGMSEVQEIGWPFVGLAKAFGAWLDEPIDLAVGVALLVLCLLFVRRVLNSDTLVGWATAGFIALALTLTEQVWRNYSDISRAVAPVLTTFVLLVFLTRGRSSPLANAVPEARD